MMGEQQRTEPLFYYFRLEDEIPGDHLLRLIDRHIDFRFGVPENTASSRQHASGIAMSPSFRNSRAVSFVEPQDNASGHSGEYPLTVREAAKYLGVSPQSVYLWVERKQIPHLRVMGRNIRFLKSDLEPFRASFRQEMENA